MGILLESNSRIVKSAIPIHLKTQIHDPAFRFIYSRGLDCLNDLNETNALKKVQIYKDELLSYFAFEGVDMLRRMLRTKKLCEIILQDFNRINSRVLQTCNTEAVALLCDLRQFYPFSSKYRNSPNALKKMADLAEFQKMHQLSSDVE